MELVAASKMKRAVSSTLSSRLYASYSREVLASVAATIENSTDPLWNERPEGRNLLVLITSNRGLCGGYNSQVIKAALSKLRDLGDNNEVDMVTVGKKGDLAMRRIDQNITGVFTDMPDVGISLRDVLPLAKLIMDEYTSGRYKKVYISYTHFHSALSQRPMVEQILPVSKKTVQSAIKDQEAKTQERNNDYLFEGDFDALISLLAEKITRVQIYQMILESNASEQSARMMAMKNASEASSEMIEDLTLAFNKARQANITREISEISAGMASLS